MAGPQAADLRYPRSRGAARRDQGHAGHQRARHVHAAFPGADRFEPVLVRPRHGASVGQDGGLRLAAEHRTAARAARLDALRGIHEHPAPRGVHPHPDFGTVEVRIADAVPTFREVGMVAALAQCLVQLFDSQLDRGYHLPIRSNWVVRDNKWRATRYGLDATVIVDDAGATAPLRDDLYELLRDLEPIAWRLGCAEELAVAYEVLEYGASYERQRAVYAGDVDLTSVVDALVAELAEDRFVLPDDGAHAG